MCEVVMAGENLAKNLDCSKYDCYPGVEESEDEKDMDHSSDIHPGMLSLNFHSFEIIEAPSISGWQTSRLIIT